MTAADDIALLERWRAGDAHAGETLFARHFTAIYSFFVTKCANEADELTQATFLAYINAKDQFRADASFRTYLFAIARNELYRVFRVRARQGEEIDFELISIAELVTSVGTRMARNEDHRVLIAALHQLPVEQQMLLELHYWEELGIGELAEIFEAPAVTIRSRLHRARKALRERVENTAPPEALQTLETMDAWVKAGRTASP